MKERESGQRMTACKHVIRQRLGKRLDKATLQQLYHGQELTAVQIANRYGTFAGSVLRLMRKYQIPRRPPGSRRSPRR